MAAARNRLLKTLIDRRTPACISSSFPTEIRLYLNFDGDGKAPAHAERFRGYFQYRSRLLPFVLAALHQFDDLAHQFEIKPAGRGYGLRRFVALYVGFEDGIEDLVGGQRVGVLLVRPQLCRGRLFEDGYGNHFALAVHVAAERVDFGLDHVADD